MTMLSPRASIFIDSMITMKTPTCAIATGLFAIALPATADTFILKNGTKLEGTIVRQDATSYVLDVHITKSIKDERVVAKADVDKIEKEEPDLAAFVEISKLVPAPDMLTGEEYAVRIRKVERFLTENRVAFNSKARIIMATLKEEANQVLAGAIKMDGKFVSPEQYKANAYEIDSQVQEAKIRMLLRDPQRVKALRAYLEFSRDFSNTKANAALLPLIIQSINAYLTEVGPLLSSYEARVSKRTRGLEQMASGDRNRTENAIREENSEQESQFKREKDGGVGWVTLHPYCKPTLTETMAFGKQELSRLSALKNAPIIDGGMIFRDTLTLIQNKGASAAVKSALADAKTAKIAPRYLAILEDAAKAAGIKD